MDYLAIFHILSHAEYLTGKIVVRLYLKTFLEGELKTYFMTFSSPFQNVIFQHPFYDF